MIKKTRKAYERINVELKVVEIDILSFLVNLSYDVPINNIYNIYKNREGLCIGMYVLVSEVI